MRSPQKGSPRSARLGWYRNWKVRGGENLAVDYLRNLARFVAPWNGVFLCLGRLYPHSADSRDCGGADPCDPGSAAGALNLAVNAYRSPGSRMRRATASSTYGRGQSSQDSQIRVLQPTSLRSG